MDRSVLFILVCTRDTLSLFETPQAETELDRVKAKNKDLETKVKDLEAKIQDLELVRK